MPGKATFRVKLTFDFEIEIDTVSYDVESIDDLKGCLQIDIEDDAHGIIWSVGADPKTVEIDDISREEISE